MNIERTCAQIGAQIKALRKKHYPNDNQTTFAVRIKVSLHTYRKIEKGDPSVSFAHYLEVAKLYGIEQNLLNIYIPKTSEMNFFESES
jgi:DNA-binding XRE family transcriptional regulator